MFYLSAQKWNCRFESSAQLKMKFQVILLVLILILYDVEFWTYRKILISLNKSGCCLQVRVNNMKNIKSCLYITKFLPSSRIPSSLTSACVK